MIAPHQASNAHAAAGYRTRAASLTAVASAVNFHQMVAAEFGAAAVLFETILHQIVI
jgi:hypothetical protein